MVEAKRPTNINAETDVTRLERKIFNKAKNVVALSRATKYRADKVDDAITVLAKAFMEHAEAKNKERKDSYKCFQCKKWKHNVSTFSRRGGECDDCLET